MRESDLYNSVFPYFYHFHHFYHPGILLRRMNKPSLSNVKKVECPLPVFDQKDAVRRSICVTAEITDFPYLQDGILAPAPGNAYRIQLPVHCETDCDLNGHAGIHSGPSFHSHSPLSASIIPGNTHLMFPPLPLLPSFLMFSL